MQNKLYPLRVFLTLQGFDLGARRQHLEDLLDVDFDTWGLVSFCVFIIFLGVRDYSLLAECPLVRGKIKHACDYASLIAPTRY